MKNKIIVFFVSLLLFSCNLSSPNSSFVKNLNIIIDNSPSDNYESKRGICYNVLSANQINLLSGKNVSWAYNWGKTSESPL